MAAPGTGWGTETLGRETREETYREGVGEIKVSLGWPNTVKLSGDQPLKRTTAEDRRSPKIRNFSPVSLTASVTTAEHAAGFKGMDSVDKKKDEVFYYPGWQTQIRQVPHCLFEIGPYGQYQRRNWSMNDMFGVIMKINGILQNYSCLITSTIDNSFIIPPFLPSPLSLFPPRPLILKRSHRSFFTCADAELEADEVHNIDKPRGDALCQSPCCDLPNTGAGQAIRPHVKQLRGKKLPQSAPVLNWETVKLPRWKQPDILTRLLSHSKAFAPAKTWLLISSPCSLTPLLNQASTSLTRSCPPPWYSSTLAPCYLAHTSPYSFHWTVEYERCVPFGNKWCGISTCHNLKCNMLKWEAVQFSIAKRLEMGRNEKNDSLPDFLKLTMLVNISDFTVRA